MGAELKLTSHVLSQSCKCGRHTRAHLWTDRDQKRGRASTRNPVHGAYKGAFTMGSSRVYQRRDAGLLLYDGQRALGNDTGYL